VIRAAGRLIGGLVPAGNLGGGEAEPKASVAAADGAPAAWRNADGSRARWCRPGGSRSREEVLWRLHFAVEDLAGGALGQFAHEPDMARVLVCRHPFPGERAQFRRSGCRSGF